MLLTSVLKHQKYSKQFSSGWFLAVASGSNLVYLFLCPISEFEAGPISIDSPQELASFQGSVVSGALGQQRRSLLGFKHRYSFSAYRLTLESAREISHLRVSVHIQTENVTLYQIQDLPTVSRQ